MSQYPEYMVTDVAMSHVKKPIANRARCHPAHFRVCQTLRCQDALEPEQLALQRRLGKIASLQDNPKHYVLERSFSSGFSPSDHPKSSPHFATMLCCSNLHLAMHAAPVVSPQVANAPICLTNLDFNWFGSPTAYINSDDIALSHRKIVPYNQELPSLIPMGNYVGYRYFRISPARFPRRVTIQLPLSL